MTKLTPIHPGQILREELRDEGLTITALAQSIRVPTNRISLIVNQRRDITADTAARLARFFGTSAQYWLNLQNHYDLECLDEAIIARNVVPRATAGVTA